jgi:hypothetical protein
MAKFEFGGSFGVSLERDCHKVEATPSLELLVTFGINLEGVCHEFVMRSKNNFITSSSLIWR